MGNFVHKVFIFILLASMGQVMRAARYDRATNEKNAIPCLKILDHTLNWHRLDDGVMGGQSETALSPSTCKDELDFSGQINTDGGGFCSVRAPIEGGLPPDTAAIKVCYTGDGKTYKVTLSDGSKSAFGPSRRSPSWQKDLPTKDGVEDTAIIPLDSLIPSTQGGPMIGTDAKMDPARVEQIGFMLSLKLSSGESNPVETFGSGIFPFSLKIRSIETVSSSEMD